MLFRSVDESYKEFSVILTAPSKTFNLAGLQTSNIIIADEKLRKAYQETMNRYGVNEPNFLGIIACMTAYNECELWVDEMLEYVYDNFTYFDEFLKENLPHIHLVKPEGLYLCWVDFRECGLDKDELEKTMLEKAGLWLDEGYIFGTGGDTKPSFILHNHACFQLFCIVKNEFNFFLIRFWISTVHSRYDSIHKRKFFLINLNQSSFHLGYFKKRLQ